MFDMFNIMNKVKEAQAKVKAAQDNPAFGGAAQTEGQVAHE